LKPSGQAFGSKVERMAWDHHDLVLAMTSHLPHLIAYNIGRDGLRSGSR
jgi:prephenate dehydrogenase